MLCRETRHALHLHPGYKAPFFAPLAGTCLLYTSLLASLDQSLKRTGLEYFDIFYSHRMDPETPLEETLSLIHI